jgi:hypothetical protein
MATRTHDVTATSNVWHVILPFPMPPIHASAQHGLYRLTTALVRNVREFRRGAGVEHLLRIDGESHILPIAKFSQKQEGINS